jgi:hypothetical protein
MEKSSCFALILFNCFRHLYFGTRRASFTARSEL